MVTAHPRCERLPPFLHPFHKHHFPKRLCKFIFSLCIHLLGEIGDPRFSPGKEPQAPRPSPSPRPTPPSAVALRSQAGEAPWLA